ncbi:MAG: adenine deaminase [Armatimonadetes bacterium]|nr:adenine deaminase [Armatimonadota bacterium]
MAYEPDLPEIIRAARGEKPTDLLLTNGRIVNVFSGEIYKNDIAIHQGCIVGIGDYQGIKKVDLKGAFVTPGLIDGHMHIESSLVDPAEFARAVVPMGTTTVIADPHEIANVRGIEGIKYILRTNKVAPLDIFAMIPSCVPATNLETSGATLTAEDMIASFTKDRVLGLGELMDFPAVLDQDPYILKKIQAAQMKRIDGHAPGVTGKDLQAYIAAGASSDHECTNVEEAREKLRLGMYIMIREGSVTQDMKALIPLVSSVNLNRCFLVTDDREPIHLLEEGHMNFLVRKAVSLGLDPVAAVSLASKNTAEYFRLKNFGAIAPGYVADLVVVQDLESFSAQMVFKRGVLVAREGKPLFQISKVDALSVSNTVDMKPLSPADLAIEARGDQGRVIGVLPGKIITEKLWLQLRIENDQVLSDPSRDILKLCVIERHHASGNLGLGLVRGLGLKKGAIGSSVAHDSHNIIAAGVTDSDILLAVNEIARIGGALVVVADGEVLSRLPLPIAGLMSDQPLPWVKDRLKEMYRIVKELGGVPEDPFMALSFLALPVIPELKLTDKGLVDVAAFRITSLFEPLG